MHSHIPTLHAASSHLEVLMSLQQILGVLACAGLAGIISLHVTHALWNVEVDGQTVLLALAMVTVPTCVGLRIKYNL